MSLDRTFARDAILKIENMIAQYKEQYPQNLEDCIRKRNPLIFIMLMVLLFTVSLRYQSENAVAEFGMVFFGLFAPVLGLFALVKFLNNNSKPKIDIPSMISDEIQKLTPYIEYNDIKEYTSITQSNISKLKKSKRLWRVSCNVAYSLLLIAMAAMSVICLANTNLEDDNGNTDDMAQTVEYPAYPASTYSTANMPDMLKKAVSEIRDKRDICPADDSTEVKPGMMVYDFSGSISRYHKNKLRAQLQEFSRKYNIDAQAFFFENEPSYDDKAGNIYENQSFNLNDKDGAVVFSNNIFKNYSNILYGSKLVEMKLVRSNPFILGSGREAWDEKDFSHQARLFYRCVETALLDRDELVAEQPFVTDSRTGKLSPDYKIYDFSGVLVPSAIDSLSEKCWKIQMKSGVDINIIVMGYHDTITSSEFDRRCTEYQDRYAHNFGIDGKSDLMTFYIGYYDGRLKYQPSGKALELNISESGINSAFQKERKLTQRINSLLHYIYYNSAPNELRISENLESIARIWGPGIILIGLIFGFIGAVLALIRRIRKKKLEDPWSLIMHPVLFPIICIVIYNIIMTIVFLCEYYFGEG